MCPPGIREGRQKAKRDNIVEWDGELGGGVVSQTLSQASTNENRKRRSREDRGPDRDSFGTQSHQRDIAY